MMRYALSNVFGDPFWLTTLPMAIVGWAVALVGSILSSAFDSSTFPVFSWWGIAFEMVAILLVLHVAFSNQIRMYRLATISFLSIATIYTTNNTNNFVWRQNSSSGTAAAGNILLSIINMIWILYLGTTQDEAVHTYIDSFAAYKKTSPAQTEYHRRMRERRKRVPLNGNHQAAQRSQMRGTSAYPYRMSYAPLEISGPTDFHRQNVESGTGGDPEANNNALQNNGNNPLHSTNMYSVEQLNRHGLNSHEMEPTSSNINMPNDQHPNNNYNGGDVQRYTNYSSFNGNRASVAYSGHTYGAMTQAYPEDPYFEDNIGENEVPFPSMEPVAKARARYSYTQEAEGELTFSEGQILEVCDMTGNWWSCRRQDGEYGMCPKNFLELLEDKGSLL